MRQAVRVQRRVSMPHELEDPDDLTAFDPDEDLVDLDDDDDDDDQLPVSTVGNIQQQQQQQQQQQLEIHPNVYKLPKEVRNLVAGGMAGMVAKSFVAPLDRIKILYQVTSAEFHLLNIPKVATKIVQTEGLSALWKGNTATMIRVFPYSGIQFMVFDRMKLFYLKQHSSDRKFGLTAKESLYAGMVAGAVSASCTYPLDLVRAQSAVLRKHKHSHNKGFVAILGDNYHSRGVAGLFRGISVTLLGILPYSGIAFALNEQGKRKIHNMTGRDVTTIERMQCGAVAGLVAQTVTYPIEVVRRRMQTLGLVGNDTAFGNVNVDTSKNKHTVNTAKATIIDRPPNVVHTVRALHAEQGMRGFFKGVSVNWMKGPIAFSISFTAFDKIQQLMESESERALRYPGRR